MFVGICVCVNTSLSEMMWKLDNRATVRQIDARWVDPRATAAGQHFAMATEEDDLIVDEATPAQRVASELAVPTNFEESLDWLRKASLGT